MKNIIILILTAIVMAGCGKLNQWTLESPDGNIMVTLQLSEEGELIYRAKLFSENRSTNFIEPSQLGLDRSDGAFSSGLRFISAHNESFSETYTLTTGKKRNISYEVNQKTFLFNNQDGRAIEVEFRMFNDGFGFRYHFPDSSEESHKIVKEISTFNLPDEGTCWSQPYDFISKYTPAYETYYERSMPIGTPAPDDKNGWSFPTTFHTNDLWVLISESNLDGTYPASHLEQNCDEGVYSIRFPEKEEALGMYETQPESILPWATPWRVVIVGETPATLLESAIITNLADPSRIDDPSWIKPGRAAWSWWSDSPSPQFVKEQNRFTDLAVEMGWEYNLIDADWNNMKDGEVTDAIDYAVRKGIRPILWYNSGGDHNEVEMGPRDRMWDPGVRADEFRQIAEWGVKGVKVDFFQSDKQVIINQYLGILEEAARNKITVNFHGCTLPRGWNRTWPNMVTLEAVRGGETYKFGPEYPQNAPWHNTVLPFTRNVVGPMDYTPVMFTHHEYPHITTYAHELATSVIFESGIVHLADKAEVYLGLPGKARQFLHKLPAVWDDIKFIDGYPGSHIILARKSGTTWYIAGLNGNEREMAVSINLNFLGEGNYILELIKDGESEESFIFDESAVQNGDKIMMSLLPYGGFTGTIAVE